MNSLFILLKIRSDTDVVKIISVWKRIKSKVNNKKCVLKGVIRACQVATSSGSCVFSYVERQVFCFSVIITKN